MMIMKMAVLGHKNTTIPIAEIILAKPNNHVKIIHAKIRAGIRGANTRTENGMIPKIK